MLYIVLKTVKIATAITKCHQKGISNFTQFKLNQSIIFWSKNRIIQLITSINKPKVIIKKGNQTNLRIGFTTKLRIPNIIHQINRNCIHQSAVISGINNFITKRISALNNIDINIFINCYLIY